jgi:acetylornithine deacetylase
MGEAWSPVEQTLARLVGWNTESHRPLVSMASWLADHAESAGMCVERFESSPGKINVVATAGPDVKGGLGLSGHMDVVPVEGQAWTTDPFCLTARDGRLLGRGTCDMKGFIAASVEAIAGMNLDRLRRPLVLIWTHDEEVGCRGSAVLAQTLAEQGRTLPEAMVVGEPTSFRVAHLHPGHSTYIIECTGRPAHSARPALGLSAIGLARDVLVALAEVEHTLAQTRRFEDILPTPHTLLNVGEIRGGTAVNIIPEHCCITVGIRPLPGVRAAEVEQLLSRALAEVTARAAAHGGTVTLRNAQCSEGLHTPETCDHISLLMRHSPDTRLHGVPFATDAGNLSTLGCAPLIFGPGSIDVAHRPDEWLERADLAKTVDIVQDLIYRRCISA